MPDPWDTHLEVLGAFIRTGQPVRQDGDARARPASVNVHMVNGFAAKELIDASHDADLVVVGSRGGGGFGLLMMGSVSSQVVHHAACLVVVVPHER